MKARLKATGEIINVEFVLTSDTYKGKACKINYYKEIDSNRNLIPESELDFEDNIDWEQRRYEIAKEIIPTLVLNSKKDLINNVKDSLKIADALIEELKKK